MARSNEDFEIRADFDRDSIFVYQAYGEDIAGPAIRDGKFSAPFSFRRMTWIKPSYLWLMARSNWGRKPGQEHILGIRISRSGWERALSLGVLTSPAPGVFRKHEEWRRAFDAARVHIQWDPERSLRGEKLSHWSIQVGLSRHVIEEYNDEWIRKIRDLTPLTRKIAALRERGKYKEAKRLLPPEKIYPISDDIAARIRGA